MAFPGCIPLEQAIRLRGEGKFVEPEYYDADKWKSQFDQQQKMWDQRMVEKAEQAKLEFELKVQEDQRRLEAIRQEKERREQEA